MIVIITEGDRNYTHQLVLYLHTTSVNYKVFIIQIIASYKTLMLPYYKYADINPSNLFLKAVSFVDKVVFVVAAVDKHKLRKYNLCTSCRVVSSVNKR